MSIVIQPVRLAGNGAGWSPAPIRPPALPDISPERKVRKKKGQLR